MLAFSTGPGGRFSRSGGGGFNRRDPEKTFVQFFSSNSHSAAWVATLVSPVWRH
ncbi:hypothetical protein BT96DRAFT_1024037 [Gymnopus androsaceus JB14]|uniref:Uncharacterized protein n=1 Tax=Gymnopus androsaceus JB14 TaxID=1447944 RepID=A0A6A4H2G4_9AGAR|nr:hypothetical protein BT96DRAFT_1024037 [Gymnopus androsaceus JB14]